MKPLVYGSSSVRPFVRAPDSFDGTLEELYERFVLPNLPAPASVRRCDALLREYVQRDDPLFLVRQVTGTVRGETYKASDGSRFMATDNAPAWWMHYTTFRDELPEGEEFARAVESAPYHFFEIARRFRGNISSAGWHVAHILAVKDRNTDYTSWTRRDLKRRFIRNVHPCNHFLVPKSDWQRWGGDPGVIAFSAGAFERRYGSVWSEFLTEADARAGEIRPVQSGLRYVSQPRPRDGVEDRRPVEAPRGGLSESRERSVKECAVVSARAPVATYNAQRLLFRADIIESLAADERFRIVTPEGVFEMSKSQFYATFANVVESRSYREGGVYHYPKIPQKALQFLRSFSR